MKNIKAMVILLLVIILASIVAGYTAGFFVYRDYKEKTTYLDKQAQWTVDKCGKLENNIEELYSNLADTVNKNKIEKEKLLSKIGAIKKDIQEWKEAYTVTVSELRRTIEVLKVERLTRTVENLQDEFDNFKMEMQDLNLKIDEVKRGSAINKDVDLGRISVKK